MLDPKIGSNQVQILDDFERSELCSPYYLKGDGDDELDDTENMEHFEMN